MKVVRFRGEDLDLSYYERQVVHSASLEVTSGNVHVLVGPNGSGKSTLLRAMARLHDADAGTLSLQGEAVSTLGRREFARVITLLSQNRPVPAGVPVTEIVEFGRHPYRGKWRARDPEGATAVAWAMEVTGVAAMAKRGVDELSGGELQRVWLACCLAQQTDVLLLDEPTNHLDLRYQVEILDLVRDLADDHGVAVGVVLHDLNQAADVADEITLLHRGVIQATGRPEEVLTSERVSEVYGLPVTVVRDPVTARLSVQPVHRTIRRAAESA
ncbi:ABC transporter ATP-binding protein [Nocardioides daejeonensis]|uniref:ABC transporter ATP-binding protein n=1 Tax=Nocardioides daejeonensis TaxID=1046556 RepID=UPI000D74ED93|nr:ABC transporter ATP-binding protein [Nocardioides daejeonensis]